MSNPSSPSVASSAPPEAAGQALNADRLREHPLWRASRPDGAPPPPPPRARGRGRGDADPPGDKPCFQRISMAALGQDLYQNADGADSNIDDEDEDHFSRVRTQAAAERDEEDSVEDDASEADGPSREQRMQGLVGAAAFGGGAAAYGRSVGGGSVASESSSRMRREAQCAAFPVRGVDCVGCALLNRLGPVERFVRSNISRMSDDSLWRQAALTYKIEVAGPIEREGAVAPAWPWKKLREHYEMCVTSNFVGRHLMIRSLQKTRLQLETRLVRVEGGDREVDRATADMLLKTINLESKERVLLEGASGKKRGRDD